MSIHSIIENYTDAVLGAAADRFPTHADRLSYLVCILTAQLECTVSQLPESSRRDFIEYIESSTANKRMQATR